MTSAHSNEAHQGSVGSVGSAPRPVEPVEYARHRVARFVGDADAPVNATLAMRTLSQPGAPPQRDHAQLLSSVDDLFGGQHQGGGGAATAPATTGSVPTVDGGPITGQQS
ncbi:hypothetical protein F5B19DRAFT_88594 [Rostrohypoxylon terebratum]|nr:hypothetical protein F5B19DRAFT_88594 [Rostrohypoxylon terebratum]